MLYQLSYASVGNLESHAALRKVPNVRDKQSRLAQRPYPCNRACPTHLRLRWDVLFHKHPTGRVLSSAPSMILSENPQDGYLLPPVIAPTGIGSE